ncbi:MAG TPA: threonine--tRNA ligase, partial [Archaeoglobus veneficus]|nr:threonine--tRNA ligase [Archaeoglobus veneficus]
MKLLLIHADYMEYEVKKKTKLAEDYSGKGERIDEVLVVFTAVEKEDNEEVVEKAVNEVVDVARKVNVDKILIYPYAHLSSNLADADKGISLLNLFEEKLNELNEFEVHRSPFGWYKAFKISCKGHPLSELSREIKGIEEDVTQALKAEEK